MKEVFVDNSITYLIKNNACSKEQINVFRYTLESLYSLVTKTSVVLLFSILLGTFKITLILLLIYSFLRGFAFGIHATKNFYCWIITLTVYSVIPCIIKYVIIKVPILIAFNIIGIIALGLWAPADTPARPLLNKKKRIVNKVISILYCLLLNGFAFICKSYLLFYIITFALVIEMICINPITYKVCHIPYRNYKK